MGGAIILNPGRAGWPAGRTSALRAPPSSLDDQGSFIISFGGHPLGTETFHIRFFPDRIEAAAEIQLRVNQGGQTVEVQANPVFRVNADMWEKRCGAALTARQTPAIYLK